MIINYKLLIIMNRGTADGDTMVKIRATNRKVAGSIPDGVIGIFH
jgi:hypothetical protein